MKLKLIVVLAVVVALMAFTAATALAQGPPISQPGNAFADICTFSAGHAAFCR